MVIVGLKVGEGFLHDERKAPRNLCISEAEWAIELLSQAKAVGYYVRRSSNSKDIFPYHSILYISAIDEEKK